MSAAQVCNQSIRLLLNESRIEGLRQESLKRDVGVGGPVGCGPSAPPAFAGPRRPHRAPSWPWRLGASRAGLGKRARLLSRALLLDASVIPIVRLGPLVDQPRCTLCFGSMQQDFGRPRRMRSVRSLASSSCTYGNPPMLDLRTIWEQILNFRPHLLFWSWLVMLC